MRIQVTMALILLTAPAGAAQDVAPAATPSLIDRIRAASKLPIRTAEVREAGVPDSSVRRVMDVFRQRNTEPAEAEAILTAERDAAREHGPSDNFGEFVQGQLESGKRGRELAEAIRAEHQARGRGHGQERAAGRKPDDAGAGRQGGEDGKQGQGGRQGRPDSAGQEGRPAAPPSQGQSQGRGQQGRGRNPN
jgi:hypothetical protein